MGEIRIGGVYILFLTMSCVTADSCQQALLEDTLCPIGLQNTISISPGVDSLFVCQNLCSQIQDCSHFTLYSLKYPQVSSCALLRSCNYNDTISCSGLSSCDSAVSGPRSPTIDQTCCKVFESRACQGGIISQLYNVTSPAECQRLCKQVEGCKFFTQYSSHFCFLHSTCDDTEPCTVCTAGPRIPSITQCKESVPMVTLLLGGQTVAQGPYSTSVELLTEHMSCVPDMPELPEGLYLSAAVLLGTTIIHCGGYSSVVPHFSRECFSHTLGEPGAGWNPAPAMNHPRRAFTLDLYNGQMFAIGGESDWGNAVTGVSVEVFTPGEGWKMSSEMQLPTPRSFHCSAIIDTRLIIIGGHVAGAAYQASVIQFDFSIPDKGWTNLQPTTYGRQHHSCQVGSFQGQQGVYVIGGSNKGQTLVEFYVDSVNRWQTLPPLTVERYYHTSSIMGGKLFVHGGGHNSAKASQEMFNRTWSSNGNIRESRYYHASVLVPEHSITCAD